MAYRMHMRIADRPQKTPRDPLARLVLAVVDGSDHPVSLRQDIVGKIQRAVFQNVHLYPFEDSDVFYLASQLVDRVPMLSEPTTVKPFGHSDPLGVVGDGDV